MQQTTLFDIEPEPTADDGLPELEGSGRQRSWAVKIRREKMAGVHTLIRQQRMLAETHTAAGRTQKMGEARAVLSRMIHSAGLLEREAESRFWIDRRGLTPEQLLRGERPELER